MMCPAAPKARSTSVATEASMAEKTSRGPPFGCDSDTTMWPTPGGITPPRRHGVAARTAWPDQKRLSPCAAARRDIGCVGDGGRLEAVERAQSHGGNAQHLPRLRLTAGRLSHRRA